MLIIKFLNERKKKHSMGRHIFGAAIRPSDKTSRVGTLLWVFSRFISSELIQVKFNIMYVSFNHTIIKSNIL